MVIFYSGTGNSRHIAKLIAQGTEDEIIDSSVYLREKKGTKVSSEKPLVFVFPAYASAMPRVFEQFILQSTFEGNPRAYFVVTCGIKISIYGMGKKLQKLCRKKGLEWYGMERFVMPENYVCLYFCPKKETADTIIYRAEKALPSVIDRIIKGEKLHKAGVISFATDVINPLFYIFLVTDRPFKVDKKKCVSCGKCEKVCPLSNVTLKNGLPTWHGNCTQCQACINVCPQKAIDFGAFTKFKGRYYLED